MFNLCVFDALESTKSFFLYIELNFQVGEITLSKVPTMQATWPEFGSLGSRKNWKWQPISVTPVLGRWQKKIRNSRSPLSTQQVLGQSGWHETLSFKTMGLDGGRQAGWPMASLGRHKSHRDGGCGVGEIWWVCLCFAGQTSGYVLHILAPDS